MNKKKKNEIELQSRVKDLEDTISRMAADYYDSKSKTDLDIPEDNFAVLTPPASKPIPRFCSVGGVMPETIKFNTTNINFKPIEDDSENIRFSSLPEEFEKMKKINDEYIEKTLDNCVKYGNGATVYDDGIVTPHSCNPDTAPILVGVVTDGAHTGFSTIMNTNNAGFRHVHTVEQYDDDLDYTAIIDDGPLTMPFITCGKKQHAPSAMIVPLNSVSAMGCAINMLTKVIVDDAYRIANSDGFTLYDDVITIDKEEEY